MKRPIPNYTTSVASALALFVLFSLAPAQAEQATSDTATESEIDYMSFSRGVLLVSLNGTSEELKLGTPQALLAIDGATGVYSLTPKPGNENSKIVMEYELPAQTTFARFRIPNVLETPSPYQTFVKSVAVFGASDATANDYELLAETQLQVHSQKNQYSSFDTILTKPITRLRLELSGGLSIQTEKTFFEFSEIEGYGAQAEVALDERFAGSWKGRGVRLELRQDGPVVSGCYDKTGELSGTVSGNVLRATGVDMNDSTRSAFVLLINEDGAIDGVRSSNGGPFRRYYGEAAANGVAQGCAKEEPITLGCGSTVYGINFDYDSARLKPDSLPVIEQLFQGLKGDTSSAITIEGHTSSEGSDSYNQALSERRAQAVVSALVAKGIPETQLNGSGLGEAQPIASNKDEVGRSMNRRVEVVCTD